MAAEVVVGAHAFFQKQQVGIDLALPGRAQDADLEAGAQGEGEQAQRGLLARRVAVEEAFDLRVVPAQEVELGVRHRGPLRGDGGLEADTPAA